MLQNAKQVDEYLTERLDGDLVLPIGVEAMHSAEINKWKYINLSDLWSEDEYSAWKKISFGKNFETIDEINQYSQNLSGLNLGKYFGFQLFVILGIYAYNYFIVDSLSKQVKFEQILIYSKLKPKDFLIFRPDHECLIAEIACKSDIFKNKIKINYVKEIKKINIKHFIKKISPNFLITAYRNRNNVNISHVTNFRSINLLLIGAGYGWTNIQSNPIFSSKFKINKLRAEPAQTKYKSSGDLKNILIKNLTWNNNLVVDVENLGATIESAMHSYKKLEKKTRNNIKKYKACLVSALTFPYEFFIADMAYQEGVPVICWQHGAKGIQADEGEVNFLTEYQFVTDYYAYGEGVANYYRQKNRNNCIKNVEVVGSMGKNIKKAGHDSILYATGKWTLNASYFNVFSDPDKRLYEAHGRILAYLNDVDSGYNIIFKINNTDGLNKVPYKYTNITIENRLTYSELLRKAKIVILDCPATTLIEACYFNLPIFALDGRTTYQETALKMIKKRVVWCSTVDELLYKVNQYLKFGIYDANVNSDEFIKAYGSLETVDGVANRVVDRLFQRISYE